MTAGVITPSSGGLVIAVDRRITYGSAHYDRPCVKAFVKHGLKIVAAGGLQKAQLLYSRLRDARLASTARNNPEDFFPQYYADNEYAADNDTTVQLLVVVGDESFHVSAEGDVIHRQPDEIWAIGSGGDFVRGFLAAALTPGFDRREFAENRVRAAFAMYPFNDVSREVDVL